MAVYYKEQVMDKEPGRCWYCDQPVAENDSDELNIDGAMEPVHRACREIIENSVPG